MKALLFLPVLLLACTVPPNGVARVSCDGHQSIEAKTISIYASGTGFWFEMESVDGVTMKRKAEGCEILFRGEAK